MIMVLKLEAPYEFSDSKRRLKTGTSRNPKDSVMLRTSTNFLTLIALLLMLSAVLVSAADTKPALTDDEKKDGWTLLFDGETTTGWKKIGAKEFPTDAWDIVDGCLHRKNGHGNDIVTTDTYENFELSLEWKIAPGGNSGVKYRVADKPGAGFGPEMQVLDDSKHPDGKDPKSSAGSLYLLFAPNEKKKLKPVDEFNVAKIVVSGNHAEHWLNGEKIVEYDFFSDEWKAAVAASKFKGKANYGLPAKNHILLQDHGNEVWFRNIKIKVLPTK